MCIDILRAALYYFTMRILEEKAEKLCSGFSLLDEEEQGYIWGILEALLFAKLKKDAEMLNPSKNEGKKQGVCSV